MKNKINLGLIGLGQRGSVWLKEIILSQNDVKVTYLCDLIDERCEENKKLVMDKKNYEPTCTNDYKDVLNSDDVDAVLIATDWCYHIEISCEAMKHGKIVGCEVGGAYNIEDCWELVRTYEETKTPIMMLENCCYGRNELMVLNMVKKGFFGDVVYCEGGYQHDLRDEIANGTVNSHYRLKQYLNRNCENYPTHEIGPIARILDINHGNRFVALSSVSTISKGMEQYVDDNGDSKFHDELKGKRFVQGDVIVTNIKCSNGELVTIKLDTTLPRPYSRGMIVHGTKCLFEEDNLSLFIDGKHNEFDFKWKDQWNNIEQYREEFDHPIWKEYVNKGIQGTHDGMDLLTLRDFIDRIKNDMAMPIDAYDMATWMSISSASEDSVNNGGAWVSLPDFTRGQWTTSPKLEIENTIDFNNICEK